MGLDLLLEFANKMLQDRCGGLLREYEVDADQVAALYATAVHAVRPNPVVNAGGPFLCLPPSSWSHIASKSYSGKRGAIS